MATSKIIVNYNTDKVESNELALSPWQEDARFILAGVISAKIKDKNGKWGDPRAVFLTNLGPLWPTMCRKLKVDTDGNIHRLERAFKTLWSDIQEAVKTSQNDWEALEKTVALYKGKVFIIRRDEFPVVSSDGRTYVTALIDADLVDDQTGYDNLLAEAEQVKAKLEENGAA